MSGVEDIRKLLEDVVTPDLKAVRADVRGDEESSKLRDEALSVKIDAKFEIWSTLIVDHAVPPKS